MSDEVMTKLVKLHWTFWLGLLILAVLVGASWYLDSKRDAIRKPCHGCSDADLGLVLPAEEAPPKEAKAK